jgi:hypothetical protein
MCLVGTKLCSMWYQTFVLNEPKPELRNSYQVGKHIERVQKMHLLPDRRNETFLTSYLRHNWEILFLDLKIFLLKLR